MPPAAVAAITLTAMLAGVPLTALAFAVTDHSHAGARPRWWRGENPAPPWAMVAVPLLTAATAALACSHRTPTAVIPAYWTTAVVGVSLAVIDLRRRRLPHAHTAVIWAVSAVCFAVQAVAAADPHRLAAGAAVAATTAGALLLTALAFPGQLGLGDVNLAAALAFTLGWLHPSAALLGLLASFTIQAFVIVGLRAGRRRQTASRGVFPLGPALIAGWSLAAFLVK